MSSVWLYDGVCVLCSSAVQYLLRHERDHEVRFVAIQSLEGHRIALEHGIDPDDPASFLFIENGEAMAKSDAVFALLAHADGSARFIRVGVIVPRRLRDWIYDRIARNRYKLFGKRAACIIPDAASRHRFVLPEDNAS
jgi:predicted DCC family thiol-disulfide oxidoreductase YuxK